MTALPKSASTVQPHYLNFSAMQVLFIGSGVHAFELEAHLIKKGLTSSKCKNIKPGKDGPQTAITRVYVVFNSLDLAVAHCNAHKRKPFVKCAKCASRKLDLIGYEGAIDSVCACSVRWSYNSIKDSGSQARFAYICDASGWKTCLDACVQDMSLSETQISELAISKSRNWNSEFEMFEPKYEYWNLKSDFENVALTKS